ncbi:type I-E CRISPR-associated endoribonuclease Cas2e [Lipingzhangella sp. LS1_29]|uniref:Type I-E CRISPR-associated endoribonuclease Cas2e n=1 Tax=Lipingzhangella rawalii TaxID=2055835 RepID=A0ABU2H5A0_9ACTN|nr:type I-E CRISPR-associated endoribonuclease Cas2e [Lipingzhangella rawalii]MDS1269794.1 type I-E CRISPR-associated endoribonuclease Cas2e [Lipingzhangella rawalii]
MVVISTAAVPEHVRGALSRWMVEPRAGLYVGTLSARVREHLWDVVCASLGEGSAVCIHPTDTEQRFHMRTAGPQRREIVDYDGLQLVQMNPAAEPEDPDDSLKPPVPPGW